MIKQIFYLLIVLESGMLHRARELLCGNDPTSWVL